MLRKREKSSYTAGLRHTPDLRQWSIGIHKLVESSLDIPSQRRRATCPGLELFQEGSSSGERGHEDGEGDRRHEGQVGHVVLLDCFQEALEVETAHDVGGIATSQCSEMGRRGCGGVKDWNCNYSRHLHYQSVSWQMRKNRDLPDTVADALHIPAHAARSSYNV